MNQPQIQYNLYFPKRLFGQCICAIYLSLLLLLLFLLLLFVLLFVTEPQTILFFLSLCHSVAPFPFY